MDLVLPLLTAIVGVPALLLLYLLVGERLAAGRSPRRRRTFRAVWWLAPAGVAVSAVLIYPLLDTIRLSFFGPDGVTFVGLANYAETFTAPSTLIALRNNVIWIVFFTAFVTVLGLVVAFLGDRVRYERLVRTVVVLPTAISFVGAGVIWGFVYDYTPPGLAQTGTLNAILTAIVPSADPIAWLTDERTVNGALIFIGIWMATGFASVILTAAIKSLPAELVEAARLDGARESQLFFRIVLPHIAPSVAVVATLMTINALKVFDIIYVLTNGNYGSQVLATSMYQQLFGGRDAGMASAIAVVLLLATAPVVALNVRTFRRQEQLR